MITLMLFKNYTVIYLIKLLVFAARYIKFFIFISFLSDVT